MCGLVGQLGRPGTTVDVGVLAAMASTIAHRGPDDDGQFIDGPVGFHHKRLSIIDVATGHQPMTADGLTIVFNGEIYNYVELREELRQKGHTFRTQSDTEVILRLYAEYGADCVRRLNGMFAFLLYDKSRQQVLAARDHFGIKPLYFTVTPDALLFASEIKALLVHPAVAAEPDPDALNDYLTFQFVLGEATLFKGIRKLKPGHFQVIDLRSLDVRTVKFWEPTFTLDPYHTEEYFIEELRRLLKDAVRLQMRSDVPVGAYLSGGMDSSLVTILASAHVNGRMKTFTGAFREGPEFNELEYAREAAKSCGALTYEVYPTEEQFIDLLPNMVYHMDEPVAGPGLFPQFIVSKLASQEVKVVLGGQGGDEIFGGYARYLVAYFEQVLKGAIYESNEEQEHIVSIKSIVPNLAALRQYAPMLQQFWSQGLFEAMDKRYFRLIDRSGGALSLLTPELRSRYHPEAIFSRFQGVFNHPETMSYYNKMTHFDLVTGLPALLQVEDRVSMAASLESRVPLLDYRICDLVTSMPPAMKFRGGEMKYILKRAVKPTLPAKILKRKDKMGFPVPLHIWARGRARGFFQDVLLSERARNRGLFDPKAVEQLLNNEAAFGRRLWGLVNLELWYRQFIDGD